MKEGWKYKKLKENARVQNGFAFDSKLFNEEGAGMPLIRIRDIKRGFTYTYTTENCPEDFHIKDEDLLIGMDGDFNVCSWSGGKALLNQRVCHVIPNDKLLSKFLYYFLPFPLLKINKKTAYSTVKHLSSKTVNDIDVPFLPLSEQERIVERLDAAFAQIDELKSNAERQLAEARALFQSALTQAMQPKPGWQEKTLPDISENLDSIRVPITKKNRTTGIYPYYGASGIVDYVDDYLFDEDLLCISEDGANLLMRTYPIAFPIFGKAWVNNHAHVLRFKNLYTQKYVEYYFESIKLDEFITGAAQPKLTQKALNSIIIPLPLSLDEQKSIIYYLNSLSSRIIELEEISRKTAAECDAMKQALLRQIFE